MRAAIYTRISDDKSGQAAGVARQERDCQTLVDSKGWSVVGIYTDNDRSAYSGKPRPEYERLLADIKAGLVEALVCWHPDRLHRSPKELEAFIDLLEAKNVAVATVQGGHYDLTTASGRMTARIVGAVSRHESEHKAERHSAKALEIAREGRPSGGGSRPFGFEDDGITHRPDEAEAVRMATKRLLAGESIRSVLVDWNQAGVLTPTGKEWRPANFRRTFQRPRVAGLREYKGEVVGPAVWDPIISLEDWESLQAVFDRNKARQKRAPRKYLLTGGLAVCGLCGADLVARPRGDGRRAYVCARGPGFRGCGKIRQLAEPLEDYVRDAVIDALAGPALAEAIADSDRIDQDRSEVLDAIAALEARLEELAGDFYGNGILSRKEYLAAKDTIDTRITALRDKLATTATGPAIDTASPEGLRAQWDNHDLAWRRQLIGVVIDQVVIAPAVRGRNFFDPGRVQLIWRA